MMMILYVCMGMCTQLLLSQHKGGLDNFKFIERWYKANGATSGGAQGGVQQLLRDIDLNMVSVATLRLFP
jgi:hypothetical protein